jgi:hypothetical protein
MGFNQSDDDDKEEDAQDELHLSLAEYRPILA